MYMNTEVYFLYNVRESIYIQYLCIDCKSVYWVGHREWIFLIKGQADISLLFIYTFSHSQSDDNIFTHVQG